MASALDINDLMDSVPVKNRIIDGPVKITFDGRLITWAPGETKTMPRKMAEWFLRKSLYQFFPGDPNDPECPPEWHYKLAIIGNGGDESDLTRQKADVPELLMTEKMPELNRVDPATGKPVKRVYINPRSTGAGIRHAHDTVEEKVTKQVQTAVVKQAAEQIAEVAQQVSETEIVEGVKSISGRMEAL